MKLAELKNHLASHVERQLRFVLPDGERIPAHAHITEVARIDKRFIDCGGVFRTDKFCRFQVWVADDLDHRFTAGKLLGILRQAAPVLNGDDLEVDIEHEREYITQHPVASVEPEGSELLLRLSTRHTDCLAKDTCGTASPTNQAIAFRPLKRGI